MNTNIHCWLLFKPYCTKNVLHIYIIYKCVYENNIMPFRMLCFHLVTVCVTICFFYL